MATRSMIVLDKGSFGYSGIYCHSDGYVSYVGLLLYCFYDTEYKIKQLQGLGSLSRLGMRLGHVIDFKKQQMDIDYYEQNKSQCCAYTRDRGDAFEVLNSKNLNDFCTESYLYVFRNGEWYYKGGNAKRLSKLRIALQKDKELDSKFQQYFYDMGNNDEKKILLCKLKELGICKIKEPQKYYDYTILGRYKNGVYQVKCNINNSYTNLTSDDIRTLLSERCTIDDKLKTKILG